MHRIASHRIECNTLLDREGVPIAPTAKQLHLTTTNHRSTHYFVSRIGDVSFRLMMLIVRLFVFLIDRGVDKEVSSLH